MIRLQTPSSSASFAPRRMPWNANEPRAVRQSRGRLGLRPFTVGNRRWDGDGRGPASGDVEMTQVGDRLEMVFRRPTSSLLRPLAPAYLPISGVRLGKSGGIDDLNLC